MDQGNGSIKCECHGHCVQMLPHPCFTIEQFLQAIYLVQSGQVGPITSPQPIGAAFMRNDLSDAGLQVTPEEDLPATEANNPSLESDSTSYPKSPQIRTYYEDSSDDEALPPCGERIPEKSQSEDAPDCDVQEISEADNV
ncbi:hypothetical protein F4604DRAFT_1925886 [Suillus subluteus]|nr:hypothetical protein F4604DRAFT_1925886 [Suillus subluteus]